MEVIPGQKSVSRTSPSEQGKRYWTHYSPGLPGEFPNGSKDRARANLAGTAQPQTRLAKRLEGMSASYFVGREPLMRISTSLLAPARSKDSRRA